jgi:hypothetical protein
VGAWRRCADPLAHQHAQVEPGHVHQETLENILVPPQVGPAHAARLKSVAEGTLQMLTPLPVEVLATVPAYSPANGVCGVTRLFLVPPVSLAALRFADVDPVSLIGESHQGVVSVVDPRRNARAPCLRV